MKGSSVFKTFSDAIDCAKETAKATGVPTKFERCLRYEDHPLNEGPLLVHWRVIYDDRKLTLWEAYLKRRKGRTARKNSPHNWERPWREVYEEDQDAYSELVYGIRIGSRCEDYQNVDWSNSFDDMDSADFESQIPDPTDDYE